jgi:C2H2-type zinc finger/Zinc finger, C2H2 type
VKNDVKVFFRKISKYKPKSVRHLLVIQWYYHYNEEEDESESEEDPAFKLDLMNPLIDDKIQCSVCLKLFTQGAVQGAAQGAQGAGFRDYRNIPEDHEDELKELQCDVCLRVFSTLKNMNRHMRVHRPADKEFQCSVCQKKFVNLWNLNRHMIRRHPHWEF